MQPFSSCLAVLGLLGLVHCTPASGTQGETVTNVYTYQLASHQDGFVINISGTGNYCQTCKNFVVAEGCKLPNEAGKGVEITCDQMWGKSGVQNVCRSRTSDAAYTCEKKKDGQPTPVCYGCDHK
ncbi:hypothetical protein H4Q26_003549 [Puccinia striiformis f. sp. tritici PST-130]|nr:hypothetical protein Pst134EB_014547 [Puccinia striiformis f. sp. tritici]KAI9603940.1 hypothetical protein H4Q26_003549 [Puccinia striiformis f. sp. tritici PST-130]